MVTNARAPSTTSAQVRHACRASSRRSSNCATTMATASLVSICTARHPSTRQRDRHGDGGTALVCHNKALACHDKALVCHDQGARLPRQDAHLPRHGTRLPQQDAHLPRHLHRCMSVTGGAPRRGCMGGAPTRETYSGLFLIKSFCCKSVLHGRRTDARCWPIQFCVPTLKGSQRSAPVASRLTALSDRL